MSAEFSILNMTPGMQDKEMTTQMELLGTADFRAFLQQSQKKIDQKAYNPGVTGDVWFRTDDYLWGGHTDWGASTGGGPPTAPLTFDTGLTKTGNSVNLDAAQPLPGEIGGINEVPNDGQNYVRNNGAWVVATGGVTPPVYTWGIGIDETTPGTIDLIAATATELGGITEPTLDGTFVRNALGGVYTWVATAAGTAFTWGIGIDETTPGTIDLLPATPLPGEIGGINEPPADDIDYVRRTASVGGLSNWFPLTSAPPLDWGVGIDITGIVVDLQPANFAPGEIGGITSEPRTDIQGLLLDDATGHITVPLATDLLAGAIVEPPADAKGYVRTTQLNGVSQWVPPAPSPGRVFISDDPPVTPETADLWWESDTGKFYLYYDDGNTQQWVQVGGMN